jgi:glycine cleavage system H protein
MVVLELKDPSEVEDLLSPEEYAGILAEVVIEEKGERVSLNIPEEETGEVIEESLETLSEEEIRYEEKER